MSNCWSNSQRFSDSSVWIPTSLMYRMSFKMNCLSFSFNTCRYLLTSPMKSHRNRLTQISKATNQNKSQFNFSPPNICQIQKTTTHLAVSNDASKRKQSQAFHFDFLSQTISRFRIIYNLTKAKRNEIRKTPHWLIVDQEFSVSLFASRKVFAPRWITRENM